MSAPHNPIVSLMPLFSRGDTEAWRVELTHPRGEEPLPELVILPASPCLGHPPVLPPAVKLAWCHHGSHLL